MAITLNDRTEGTMGGDDVSFPLVINSTQWQVLRIADRNELDELLGLLNRATVILDTPKEA